MKVSLGGKMSESVRIIKKYQNRKLYDTQNSCYVTLDGLAKMIRDGQDIIVIDNNTKADVTGLILTQVLYEQEKTNQSILPVSLLKTIVKSSSNSLFEFLQKYIFGSIDSQIRNRTEIETYINRLTEKGDLSAQEGSALQYQLKVALETHRSKLDQKIDERLEKFLSKRNNTNSTSIEFTKTPDYPAANRNPQIDTAQ